MDIIFHRNVLNYFDDIARQAGSAYFNATALQLNTAYQ